MKNKIISQTTSSDSMELESFVYIFYNQIPLKRCTQMARKKMLQFFFELVEFLYGDTGWDENKGFSGRIKYVLELRR